MTLNGTCFDRIYIYFLEVCEFFGSFGPKMKLVVRNGLVFTLQKHIVLHYRPSHYTKALVMYHRVLFLCCLCPPRIRINIPAVDSVDELCGRYLTFKSKVGFTT